MTQDRDRGTPDCVPHATAGFMDILVHAGPDDVVTPGLFLPGSHGIYQQVGCISFSYELHTPAKFPGVPICMVSSWFVAFPFLICPFLNERVLCRCLPPPGWLPDVSADVACDVGGGLKTVSAVPNHIMPVAPSMPLSTCSLLQNTPCHH